MTGQVSNRLVQMLDDDGDDEIWDDNPTLSYEEDDDISLDEQWMIPHQYRSPCSMAPENPESPTKSTQEHSGHQRSIGKINIEYRPTETVTEICSSSSSLSSTHSRSSSHSTRKSLIRNQGIATAPRKSRNTRYLDDRLNGNQDEDLFMVCDRSSTKALGNEWSFEQIWKEQLLGESCPEFGAFQNPFRDDKFDFPADKKLRFPESLDDDKLDWTLRPIQHETRRTDDSWWLPDVWSESSFSATQSFEKSNPILPTQERQFDARHENKVNKLVEFGTGNAANPAPTTVPEMEAREPLLVQHISSPRLSAIWRTSDTVRGRRSSLDTPMDSQLVKSSTRSLRGPRSRYRALPSKRETPLQLPPAFAFLADKLVVNPMPKHVKERQKAEARVDSVPKRSTKPGNLRRGETIPVSDPSRSHKRCNPAKCPISGSEPEPAWLLRVEMGR